MANERARMSVPPGTRFGRYEVIADIASGGMAMVYLGRALGAGGFQRLVAIKLMHAQYANDEEFVAMFMDEARLAARIRHPNVVATLDLENDDDGLYLVMEYIEGDGMLSLLRAAQKDGKRIPPPVVLRMVLDMLNGLHAAHELTGDRGEPLKLVHRDISPHNVIVGIDGISRITDFGIAHAEERMGATRDGQVKGKLAYMAPEQTSGTPVDRRADLFATGVVLWECLSGKRLFWGQNDGEVLRNLLVNPVPRLKDVMPELPPALDEVCNKALARDPDARYTTAAQFADALEEAGGSIAIASARAVSQHVREVAGDKISAMAARARGAMAISADVTGQGSAIRSVRRRTEGTDPERTIRRDEASLSLLDQDPMRPGTGSKKIARPPAPPPVPDLSPMLVPDVDVSDEIAPPTSRRKTGLLVAGVLGTAVLVGGAVVLARRHETPPPVPVASHRVTPAARPAIAPAPIAAPVVAVPPPPPVVAAAPPVVEAPAPAAPAQPPAADMNLTDSPSAASPGAGDTADHRHRAHAPANPAHPAAHPAAGAPAHAGGGSQPFNPESM